MRLESFWEWCVNHPGPAAARLFEDGLARADSITAARQVTSRGFSTRILETRMQETSSNPW